MKIKHYKVGMLGISKSSFTLLFFALLFFACKVKVEEKKIPDSITCTTRRLTLSPGESQSITLVPFPHDAVLNLSE